MTTAIVVCSFISIYSDFTICGHLFFKFLLILILSFLQTRSPSKAAGMFSGTQEKCATCAKTAYPLEKVGQCFSRTMILYSLFLFMGLIITFSTAIVDLLIALIVLDFSIIQFGSLCGFRYHFLVRLSIYSSPKVQVDHPLNNLPSIIQISRIFHVHVFFINHARLVHFFLLSFALNNTWVN